jgi:hypothetical protein
MADRYPYGSERGEFDRERWSEPARDRWSGDTHRGQERNYGSDREYGRNEYGRGRGRERELRPAAPDPHDFDEQWRRRSSSRDDSGLSFGLSGGHRDDARVVADSAGLEAGYLSYHRPDDVVPPHPGREHAEPPRGEWRREYSSEWWRVPGPHAGRGPRGYQRSDERIREELHDRLTAHGMIDATDIECQVANGEVTLTGFVSSRIEKRGAEDVADDIAGVREVHNHLRLRSNVRGEGVGQTSVLGLTESEVQRSSAANTAEPGRSRSRS